MAYSGSQITREGLSGVPRGLYGDFTGKEGPGRVVPRLTRLGLGGFTRSLYGDFSGKGEQIVVEAPAIGGGSRLHREDEEILVLIMAALNRTDSGH